jgi:AcrR family transcriptional regulator
MVQTTIDNDALTNAVFETFRKYGYAGATIAILSSVTGLKKSSLYHHFPAGKDDMAKAAVGYMQIQMQQNMIIPLLNKIIAPENRFDTMIAATQQFFVDGTKNCLLNVLSLGEVKPNIQQQLNAIYDAFLYALEKLAQEVGMDAHEAKLWAERFLIFLQGALVIQRLTKNNEMFIQQLQYEQQQFKQLIVKGVKRESV